MIASSFVIVGIMIYDKYKIRSRSLDWFIDLFSAYQGELKWSKKSIFEVLLTLRDDKHKQYVNNVISNYDNMDALSAFVLKNDYFRLFSLNSDDISILKHFFLRSGNSNLQAEVSLCEKTIEALKNAKQVAEGDLNKLGPLYFKLSLICGAWIFLILI